MTADKVTLSPQEVARRAKWARQEALKYTLAVAVPVARELDRKEGKR